MNTNSQPIPAPEYWLRGPRSTTSHILFCINYSKGRPVEGLVAHLANKSFLPIADEIKVDGKTFSRLKVYTADELRSLWTILTRSGYWERCDAPVRCSAIHPDPFSDKTIAVG